VSFTFANEKKINGKVMRSVRASTYDEYIGKKISAVRPKV